MENPNAVPPSNQPAPESKPDPYAEKFAQLESLITNSLAGMQKQLNGISFAARAAKKESEEPTPEQHVTLKSLKQQLESRDQKIRERAINAEIDAYLKGQNIPDGQAKILKAYIRNEYAAKHDENGNFLGGLSTDDNDNVFFQDPLGNKKSVADIGKSVLASIGAEQFVPPVQTPGPVGTRAPWAPNQGGPQGVPELGSMTVEQMMANPQLATQAAQAAAARVMQNGTVRT